MTEIDFELPTILHATHYGRKHYSDLAPQIYIHGKGKQSYNNKETRPVTTVRSCATTRVVAPRVDNK